METETRAKYGPYTILGTLGKGSFGKVKLAEKDGQKYAIKFLSNNLPPNIFCKHKELLLKEISILQALDHPNLVHYVDSSLTNLYIKRNGKQYERLGLVLQYLPSYDLFEVLQQGALGEELGRTYFHQLIEGLQYLHNASVMHRDLKPDNILFDQNLNLRITDFGLSKIIESGPPTTICGTAGYKCPEMLLSIKYNGILNDLFAAGVLLVNLVTGRSPFNCADPKSSTYKYMANNQHQKFWAEFEKKVVVDAEFKDLVNGMLAFDPSQRLTISEIKCHPWYKRDVLMGGGTQLSYADLADHMATKIEMVRRKKNSQQMLKEVAVRETQQQQPAKVSIRPKAFRQIEKSEGQEEGPLTKRKFNPLITKATDIYIRPVKSLRRLAQAFTPLCTEVRMFTDGETKLVLKKVHDNESVVAEIKVLSVDEKADCLRFSLTEGSFDRVMDFMKEIAVVFEGEE